MAMPFVTSFRGYAFFSILLSGAVLTHAIYTKRFFYRTVVYLSESKLAIMAAANMALVSILLVWRIIQLTFLGPLRFRELERLQLRARDAIIEYCFAISVFRDDFNYQFVALVMTVLLLKSLHWLAKDRTDFLEEQPLSPVKTHLRLVGLLVLLCSLDCFLAISCVRITFNSNGRSMYVLFSFEFTLLLIELASNVFQYIFLLIDQRMQGRWESKGLFTFYADLLCDMSTLTFYIIFLVYVQIYYSFPYHILRELYVTLSKFQRRCTDFLRYRRVVANMNEVVEQVTEEELQQGDRTCIICREEMESAIKLACGHMFHPRCLQSWLKRQLSCPTCRATIDVDRSASRNQNNNSNQNANANQPAGDQRAQPENQAQRQRPQQPPQQNRAQQQQQRQPPHPVAAQNPQLGEAGARLYDFANQWFNQVMNEAGIRQQPANAVPPNGANQPQPNARHQHPNPIYHRHQHHHPPIHPRTLQEQIAAQAQHQNGQRPNPNGLPRYPFPARQNAIAHMQLRARRRGALGGLAQAYDQQYRVQLPPLNNLAGHRNRGQDNPPTPAAQTGQEANMENSDANAQRNSNLEQTSNASRQSAASSSPPSSASGSASASSSTPSQSTHRPSSASRMARTQSTAGHPGHPIDSASMTQYEQGLRSGIQFYQNVLRARDQAIAQHTATTRALPLERLFEIQRQIEVLRSEVQDLVLQVTDAQMNTADGVALRNSDGQQQATAAPAETEVRSEERTEAMSIQQETARTNNAVETLSIVHEASDAEDREPVEEPLGSSQIPDASAASGVQGRDEQRENEAGEEDSVAERIRRRRLQFLERNNGL